MLSYILTYNKELQYNFFLTKWQRVANRICWLRRIYEIEIKYPVNNHYVCGDNLFVYDLKILIPLGVSVYLYIYVCTCVCVCVCTWERVPAQNRRNARPGDASAQRARLRRRPHPPRSSPPPLGCLHTVGLREIDHLTFWQIASKMRTIGYTHNYHRYY